MDARDRGVIWGSQALPTFHTMGIYMQLYVPLVSGYPVGLYAPKAPASPVVPTPANILEACRSSGSTGIAIVPAMIEVRASPIIPASPLSLLDTGMGAVRRRSELPQDTQGSGT